MTAELQGPIRAVLFDVDGTLYAQTPLRVLMACEMALASLSADGKRQRTDVRLALAFRKVREKLRSTDRADERLVALQYSAVSERMRCAPADVQRAVNEWIYRRPLKWLRACRRGGLNQLLEFLGTRDVRCGVFSDYPAADKLAALGIGDRFELELSAVDPAVGAFKPSPRGFRIASERWGIPPREILYVGDRSDVDAAGAVSAGMQCALLTARRPADARFIAVTDFRELQRALDPVC
jgi:FMN phosphatase YigB (HAD superfamily)